VGRSRGEEGAVELRVCKGDFFVLGERVGLFLMRKRSV
jgi:hypothetical protein